MADQEAVVLESTATPEVQARAREMGWIPPDRFSGDPERFVDAEEYVRRGEEVLPILRKQKADLEGKLAAESARLGKVEAALAAATKSLEEIELRNSVATQKAVEKAREEVKTQLKAASEAGDHEAVAELTDALTQMPTKEELEAEAAVGKKTTVQPPAPEIHPDVLAWNQENPWFGSDKRKTAVALAIGQELREAGDRSVGRAFFDKISAEMEKSYPSERRDPPVDKVSGARHGGDEPARGGKKSYNSLPADAKAACDADMKRFVGPNKSYKDPAAWRARYAEIYFSQES